MFNKIKLKIELRVPCGFIVKASPKMHVKEEKNKKNGN